MRLLDVGCGWGGMVRHAARNYGVEAVGITVSAEQARWARARVEAEGLTDRVEIRLQDYRDVHDGPYDAISSIGMFEHVGRARAAPVLPGPLRPAAARWPAAQPRHQPSAQRGRAHQPPGLHGPLRVPRRRAHRGRVGGDRAAVGRASRPATSRTCASTTRSRCGPGWPTWRPTGTRPSSGWARPGPASGASTWPAARSTSTTAARPSTRCWASSSTRGVPGMPLRPRWDRLALSRWGAGIGDPIVLT